MFLSRLLLCALVSSLLAGCAAPPTQKQLNRSAIEKIDKVEIFYNAEQLTVLHDFGEQSMRSVISVGSFLGAGGTIAATAVALLASKAAIDETIPRSKAFREAVSAETAGAQDMNADLAHQMASKLRAMGKTVKVTQVATLPGAKPGMRNPLPQPKLGLVNSDPQNAGALPDAPEWRPPEVIPELADTGFEPTAGFAPLLLRVTTGYGSHDALADFRSVAEVEYALVDAGTRRYLVDAKLTSINKPEGPTYFAWPALLADAPAARAQIRRSLHSTGESVPERIFSFDKP